MGGEFIVMTPYMIVLLNLLYGGALMKYTGRHENDVTAPWPGKWHLGAGAATGPLAHGFDDFFGFEGWNVGYYDHLDPDRCRR